MAKLTFEMLARRQEKCVRLIQRITLTLEGDPNLRCQSVRFPTFQPVQTIVESVFREAGRSPLDDTTAAQRDVFKAYLWAFGFEEKGTETYSRLAQRAECESVAVLFDFLRKRKGDHYQILDQTLAHIHSPESISSERTNSPIC